MDNLECRGSGVPGDVFEFGHAVIPGTEHLVFPEANHGANRYSPRRRCAYCQSTRYHHKREDCVAKAAAWRREHAGKMVKRGYAATTEDATAFMERSGLTIAYVAKRFRDAIGKPCPGLCGFPEPHIIKTHADCQGDWLDPNYPLTPDNFGIKCATCNQQKNDRPDSWFIARQHAIRINLESSIPKKSPPVQLTLF